MKARYWHSDVNRRVPVGTRMFADDNAICRSFSLEKNAFSHETRSIQLV